MLDKDNYPDEKDLKEIERWDIIKQGVRGLLVLVEENTNWPDWAFSIKGKRVLRFEFHTGGWSGNEDVISALQRNILFFPMFWRKSEAGGHYYFKIKPFAKNSRNKRKENP